MKLIRSHFKNKKNPIKKMLDSFSTSFESSYQDYVNTDKDSNKNLLGKIQSLGKDFILKIFKGVNEFIHMLFESLIVMYDPNEQGILEFAEREIDKFVLDRTLQG